MWWYFYPPPFCCCGVYYDCGDCGDCVWWLWYVVVVRGGVTWWLWVRVVAGVNRMGIVAMLNDAAKGSLKIGCTLVGVTKELMPEPREGEAGYRAEGGGEGKGEGNVGNGDITAGEGQGEGKVGGEVCDRKSILTSLKQGTRALYRSIDVWCDWKVRGKEGGKSVRVWGRERERERERENVCVLCVYVCL